MHVVYGVIKQEDGKKEKEAINSSHPQQRSQHPFKDGEEQSHACEYMYINVCRNSNGKYVVMNVVLKICSKYLRGWPRSL